MICTCEDGTPEQNYDKVQDEPFNYGCRYEWPTQAVPTAS